MKLINEDHGHKEARNMIVLIMFTAAVLIWLFVVLAGKHHKTRTAGPKSVSATVKKLKPTCAGDACKGTYVYQDSSGLWWYYVFVMNSSNTSYSDYGSSLPPGGSWSQTAIAPEVETVMEESTVSVVESAAGEPVSTDVDTHGESTTDYDPGTMTTETTETSTTSTDSSSSSSSSDSGSSGGDSGGGGGDSGGGGD